MRSLMLNIRGDFPCFYHEACIVDTECDVNYNANNGRGAYGNEYTNTGEKQAASFTFVALELGMTVWRCIRACLASLSKSAVVSGACVLTPVSFPSRHSVYYKSSTRGC